MGPAAPGRGDLSPHGLPEGRSRGGALRLVRSPRRRPRRSASAHQLSLTHCWLKPKLGRCPRRLALALTAASENTPPSGHWIVVASLFDRGDVGLSRPAAV